MNALKVSAFLILGLVMLSITEAATTCPDGTNPSGIPLLTPEECPLVSSDLSSNFEKAGESSKFRR